MDDKWRGWPRETRTRKRFFIATLVTLAVIAFAAGVGTVGGGGLPSPWLWVGLALVPVLLWLVSRTGLSR